MLSLRRISAARAAAELATRCRAGFSTALESATAAVPSQLPDTCEELHPASTLNHPETDDPLQASRLDEALRMPIEHATSAYAASPSERDSALALFRLHNSSMPVSGGHMIKARVLQVDKKAILLDTGVKLAKIAASDITADCILEKAERNTDGTAHSESQLVCPGDVVQVYLEHAETPEGDMLVSGQQAAVKKRVSAVWHELEQAMRSGKPVKGRVLNSITGGYAVGVGGLVCFVANACITPGVARRIGELREYRVVKMVPERNNVVLEDYRYSVQNQTRAMQRHQAALARKKDINIGGGGISR